MSEVPFDAILLLERAQLRWFPGKDWDDDFALALGANPSVQWYIRHKCPEIVEWLDRLDLDKAMTATPAQVRVAELAVLKRLGDLMVYALAPEVYDSLPHLGWDSRELTDLVDFAGKRVIDVGAGTGRLALVAAESADAVFAVEPVGRLRDYLRGKARSMGITNVYPVDGLVTDMPFPDGFADVVMGGHVFGDDPEDELAELERVTVLGGIVILCPGNRDEDNDIHALLTAEGYSWASFVQPVDGGRRKYWRVQSSVIQVRDDNARRAVELFAEGNEPEAD